MRFIEIGALHDGAETTTAFTGVNFASDTFHKIYPLVLWRLQRFEMFNQGHTILSGVDQAISNSFGLNLERSNIWGSRSTKSLFGKSYSGYYECG